MCTLLKNYTQLICNRSGKLSTSNQSEIEILSLIPPHLSFNESKSQQESKIITYESVLNSISTFYTVLYLVSICKTLLFFFMNSNNMICHISLFSCFLCHFQFPHELPFSAIHVMLAAGFQKMSNVGILVFCSGLLGLYLSIHLLVIRSPGAITLLVCCTRHYLPRCFVRLRTLHHLWYFAEHI
jgi:hypothetical protein